MNKIGLGGGCHWCTEAVFQNIQGVEKVEQGWISSTPPHDTLSEGVIVHYDPKEVGLYDLILKHLKTHSFASNHSMRKKYRSAVYCFSDDQAQEARKALEKASRSLGKQAVTMILPFKGFVLNQEKYLNYYRKNPDSPFSNKHIRPKLEAREK